MPDTLTEHTPEAVEAVARAICDCTREITRYDDHDDRNREFWRRHARAAIAAVANGQKYLVWSNEHKAWWGKDRCGYTRIIANAGRYDRDEALSIAGTRGGGWYLNKGNPDEIAIPEQDAIDQYADITRAQQSGARA